MAALTVGASMSFANTISGSFKWVTGTTTTTVAAKTTAQTLVIKVGTTNETFPDVMVPGLAGVTSFPAGTPIALLEAGSQPFAATYPASSTVLFSDEDGSGIAGRRAVPISTAGVLSDSLLFPNYGTGYAAIALAYPDFTIGTLAFKNGLVFNISSFISSYSIALPTATASTLGDIVIPTTDDPIESFDFEAIGNGTISVSGSGRSNSEILYVSGVAIGTATTFTTATFSIAPSGF